MNLRHFLQKVEDLKSKFIVKVANHYKSARLTPKQIASPFDMHDNIKIEQRQAFSNKTNPEHKPGKTGVFALIIVTILICLAAYYFGL